MYDSISLMSANFNPSLVCLNDIGAGKPFGGRNLNNGNLAKTIMRNYNIEFEFFFNQETYSAMVTCPSIIVSDKTSANAVPAYEKLVFSNSVSIVRP